MRELSPLLLLTDAAGWRRAPVRREAWAAMPLQSRSYSESELLSSGGGGVGGNQAGVFLQ